MMMVVMDGCEINNNQLSNGEMGLVPRMEGWQRMSAEVATKWRTKMMVFDRTNL
jgi:hypothetical protein